jgi:hypothetical protein
MVHMMHSETCGNGVHRIEILVFGFRLWQELWTWVKDASGQRACTMLFDICMIYDGI